MSSLGRVRRRALAAGRDPAPFIVGATRSGTTLLRLMLDAHPALAIPSETHFVPEVVVACRGLGATRPAVLQTLTSHRRWGDFALEPDDVRRRFGPWPRVRARRVLRAFYRAYAESEGKRRWGDKTPGYLLRMHMIQNVLPEARFVHLIRDGRDVALSILGQDFGPDSVAGAAERWRNRITRARRQAPDVDHYLELRYENLVQHPEASLRRVCEFVKLDYDPVMLAYHERAGERLAEKARPLPRGPRKPPRSAEERLASHALAEEPPRPERIARWRSEMGEPDVAEFERVAGDLLAELGYELGSAAVQR